jgi:hypothetical protein
MSTFVGANLTKTYTAAELATEGSAPAYGDVYNGLDGKRYKFVKYNNGQAVAAVAGNFCYVHAASGASAGEYKEVTMDLSDSAGVGAGVLLAVIADGSYGWIQTWGVYTLTTALTAGADGNALTPVGSSDGTLDVSALVTDHLCAFALDASAKIVFVTCP